MKERGLKAMAGVLIIGVIAAFWTMRPSVIDREIHLIGDGVVLLDMDSRTIQDINEERRLYNVTGGEVALTIRTFPNGDKMIYVQAEVEPGGQQPSVTVALPLAGEVQEKWTIDTPVPQLYPYRKTRKPDPLSTTLRYIEKKGSIVLGTQVYYRDMSKVYSDGEVSRAVEFLREADAVRIEEEWVRIPIRFRATEENYATWIMLSDKKLFKQEAEFAEAHRIGADEFRWITPDTLWSHGLRSIEPLAENAFVRSLVRQSGRASSLALEETPTRFWQNINRHQFASLEAARAEDGLWHTDYTSTWLKTKYGIGPDYVDSRHNDNIFRSQLRRAELLGYAAYAEERKRYADFLLEMADRGFILPEGDGYYLIDYYDFQHLTHASLNHALSLANYLYDAYLATGDERYLTSANEQFAALNATGRRWLEDGSVLYQLNPDGTLSGKDYQLVTYYDLLYMKELRQKLKLGSSPTLDALIAAKQAGLEQQGFDVPEIRNSAEEFIGLIE